MTSVKSFFSAREASRPYKALQFMVDYWMVEIPERKILQPRFWLDDQPDPLHRVANVEELLRLIKELKLKKEEAVPEPTP